MLVANSKERRGSGQQQQQEIAAKPGRPRINLFNSHNKPLQHAETETERLSNLAKVTQRSSYGTYRGNSDIVAAVTRS